MRLCCRAAMLAALSFLIASSLLSTASAQFPVPVYCAIDHAVTDMGSCLANAIPLAILGILISLLIIALSYMLGEVIHIESLKGWYKNELKETAKSLMIIAIVISMLAILSGIASVLSNSTPAPGVGAPAIEQNLGNLYNAASGYLTDQQNYGIQAFSYITGLSLGIGLIKNAMLYLWIPFPVVPDPLPPFALVWFHFGSSESIYQSTIIDTSTTAPVNNLAFIRDVYEFLILPMYLAFTAQADLLPILMQVGLLVLFPIGIILRSMPFVRGIGGTLIAIGIALSLVYPMVLVGFNIPASSFLLSIPNHTSSGACNISIPLLGSVICWLSGTISSSVGVLDGVASLTSIYPAFNGIQYYTYPITVQFVLLLLDVVIVVTISQNIARLLGGSIRLGLGGRLKLA